MEDVTRREAIALLTSALAVAPTQPTCNVTRVVEFSAEAEQIIQSLIDSGRYKTRDDVVAAALDVMMAQEGYPVERSR